MSLVCKDSSNAESVTYSLVDGVIQNLSAQTGIGTYTISDSTLSISLATSKYIVSFTIATLPQGKDD